MNKLFFYIVLTSLVPVVATMAQDDSQNPKKESAKIAVKDTLVYKVYGMDCPGCHGALEKQVKKLPSIESATANYRAQELQIVVEQDSLDERKLFERIKKANFTPGDKVEKQ